MQSIETIPVMQLSAQEISHLVTELEDYHAIYSPLFQRRDQREWSSLYLQGLLLEIPRKSIEPMVLALRGKVSELSIHSVILNNVEKIPNNCDEELIVSELYPGSLSR